MNQVNTLLMIILCVGQFSCSIDWTLYKADKIKKTSFVNNNEKVIKLYKRAYNHYNDHDRNKSLVSFKIAECYRLNNDTTCKSWYVNSIDLLKRSYTSCKCSKEYKLELLKCVSLCYYYLTNYEQAIYWFDKVIFHGKYLDLHFINYYVDSLTKLNKTQDIQLFYDKVLQLIKDNKNED